MPVLGTITFTSGLEIVSDEEQMEQLFPLLDDGLDAAAGVVDCAIGAIGDEGLDGVVDGEVGVLPPEHPHVMASFGSKLQALCGTPPPTAKSSI